MTSQLCPDISPVLKKGYPQQKCERRVGKIGKTLANLLSMTLAASVGVFVLRV
jgi:hypothetical protein